MRCVGDFTPSDNRELRHRDLQYRAKLNELDFPWLEISSNATSPDQVVKEIATNEGQEDKPLPFLGADLETVYEFWKQNIRPSETSTAHELFRNFTFIVVTEKSIEAERPNCTVCCDAPDYNEETDTPTLKSVTVNLRELPLITPSLEELTATPSELLSGEEMLLCSIPPFTQKAPTRGDRSGDYVVASAKEARAGKQQGLKLRPEPRGRALDHDREAVLFRCPFQEAVSAAQLHQQVEEIARKEGIKIRLDANPSRSSPAPKRSEGKKGNDGDNTGDAEGTEGRKTFRKFMSKLAGKKT